MTLEFLTIVELLTAISEAFSFPSLLLFSLAGIVAAFFGYYIFMKALRVIVALEFGTIAYGLAVTYLPAGLSAQIGLPISIAAVVGILFAILGAIFAHRIYKLFIFATGAAFGAVFTPIIVAAFVPSIAGNVIIGYILMGLGALIFALIFRRRLMSGR